jgi:hypothetical protein
MLSHCALDGKYFLIEIFRFVTGRFIVMVELPPLPASREAQQNGHGSRHTHGQTLCTWKGAACRGEVLAKPVK